MSSGTSGDVLAAVPPSPTPRLLIGIAAILATVAVFALWSLYQLNGLRKLQTDTIERNRRDSLQLIRIQNDLNSLGLAMRDMVEDRDGYGMPAWRGEFARLRRDLDDAIRLDGTLAVRPPEQKRYLEQSLTQFWRSAEQIFSIAEAGDTDRARRMVADSLQAQQSSLASTVARLLVQNNEAEELASREINAIYDGVERNLYLFLTAMLLGTAAIGLLIVQYNRRIFDQLGALSQQRSTLAQGLISVQEEVFHSVSRELHDDFGQILTAVGTMLRRAEKKGLPPESPLRAEMSEIREVVQEAIEKTRSFSQALHPTILDDYGLERAVERYIQTFGKQTGIPIELQKRDGIWVPDGKGIHVYRVLQEALNNVARHSQATAATVRLIPDGERLRLEVEDNGVGIPEKRVNGLGLIAMKERAELMGGSISVKRGTSCGTLVVLEVPLAE
jgi:signal transduction histidine kinase